MPIASIIAARANRRTGRFAQATPTTEVRQIIGQFLTAFKEHLCQWSGVCYTEEEMPQTGTVLCSIHLGRNNGGEQNE